eukprot:gnl/MRDRNA2_/MRDRNA2_27895_c0_seq1.p1 gnl/MRDRNA2_/MRDRNA2_27895_c0~~gnl/MRDRNA2_/MRDRNA2_27895_c0_seq1.p1  ORF type:complete len:323 (+),score=78.10 gnl/MRDRNA2_/MRDRNA2_27895_c0_seq1:86-970(+)
MTSQFQSWSLAPAQVQHLALSSGGTLDINHLPEVPTLEMLEACVARIRDLHKFVYELQLELQRKEKKKKEKKEKKKRKEENEEEENLSMPTPARKRLHSQVWEEEEEEVDDKDPFHAKGSESFASDFEADMPKPRVKRPRQCSKASVDLDMPLLPVGAKPLPAPIAKSIVAEMKTKLKSMKFFPGSHAEARLIRFSAPRIPPHVVEQLQNLGPTEPAKQSCWKIAPLEAFQILRLKPGDLKATLYKKPHRFSKRGAKPTRWGTAPLDFLSCELSYKSGALHGHFRCINSKRSDL